MSKKRKSHRTETQLGSSSGVHLSPTRRIQKWQLIVAVIGTAIAVSGIWFAYFAQERRRVSELERGQANISVQGGVRPVRSRGPRDARVPIGWEAWWYVIGEGPATAKQLIVNIWPTQSDTMWHGQPEIVSRPTAGQVEIVERSEGRLYQLVVKNLQAGDGFLMVIPFAPGGSEVSVLADLWQIGMFSREFSKHFISMMNAVGENVHISFDGMTEFSSGQDVSRQ
jgi:hypothetical protein